MNFSYISHQLTKIHMNHIFHMKCTVLLVFSMFFFTAKTYTSSTFHMYTKIHMYHIFYMKCTVLLVFSCVFTVFSLQKHVILVYFTCLYQNTYEPCIVHEMNCFASVFMCFHCVLLCRNMYFWYISHIYIKIHM
jgi:hypothetical protein